MKVRILALEVKHGTRLVEVIPLASHESIIDVKYPTALFSLDELRGACNGLPLTDRRQILGQYADEVVAITLTRKANNLPCIGDVRVCNVVREIEWPE